MNTITKLEGNDLGSDESLRFLQEAEVKFKKVNTAVGKTIYKKFRSVFEKNPDLPKIKAIDSIMKRVDTDMDNDETMTVEDAYNPDELIAISLAPLVSVEVERSFSRYKSFLRDNRMSFQFANLRMYMFVYCNSSMFNDNDETETTETESEAQSTNAM